MENEVNGESETSFDDLPPETTVEIFSRLPVKTLIISTSVNKSWYSLIKSPTFISAHIQHSISCADETAVLTIPISYVSQQKYCYFMSFKYEIPFTTRTDTLQLVGSVNGLLCLTDAQIPDVGRDLYFWNPAVRKCKSVITSCPHKWEGKFFNVVGLGILEPSNDYRVVRIMYYDHAEWNLVGKRAPKVEVFSLRLNKWREIENPRVPRVAGQEIGITVDGMVYWMGCLGTPQTRATAVWIMSFDFKNEVFGLVKLPDDVRYCLEESASYDFFRLMKFGGHFVFVLIT